MPDENVMSRADVIAGVLAEHAFRMHRYAACYCGWRGQETYYSLSIIEHRAHVAAVLATAEPAAEQARAGALTEAEAALDRVRALVDEWAKKCPPNDWPEEGGVEVAVLADAGRAIRAALAGDAEHERSGT